MSQFSLKPLSVLRHHLALFLRLCTVMALVVAGSQLAQAVTISYNSVDYDVITTSDVSPGTGSFPYPAITYQTLSTTNWNGYSYTFADGLMAASFATAYNASSAPSVLKTANDGLPGHGEIPGNPGPGNPGGPLFFTNIETINFFPGTTLTTANGKYFTNTAVNFGATAGGTGALVSARSQLEVWALYKVAPAPSSVPEIDPSSLGSVLALVLGSLGLLERRRLKAA